MQALKDIKRLESTAEPLWKSTESFSFATLHRYDRLGCLAP
jgi:hypothetical protein